MDYGDLTRKQRAELGRLSGQAGFQPQDLQWFRKREGVSTELWLALRHRPSNLWFAFRNARQAGHAVRMTPGPDGRLHDANRLSWADVLDRFELWLQLVRLEIDSPDFYNAIAEAHHQAVALPRQPYGEDPFTPEEAALLGAALDKAVAVLSEPLAEAANAAVVASIELVKANLTNLSRSLWVTTCLGTMLQLATRYPEMAAAARQAWPLFVVEPQESVPVVKLAEGGRGRAGPTGRVLRRLR